MSAQALFRLDGRVAFLSGAAGHLGREMAFALGEAGTKLIINGRNAARLQAFASELVKAGFAVECAAFDMMDFVTVRSFFGARPRLDILINNAVTMTPKSLAEVTPEDFDISYRSAVTAAFEAVRAARPVEGGAGARMPFDRSLAERRRRLAEGEIDVADQVHAALANLAKRR